MNSKLEIIINLFEGKEIRSVWIPENEDYQFSVIDVISALMDSNYDKSRNYWKWLKGKLGEEGSKLVSETNQLKMKAKDGKMRDTDTLDTKGIFRLIESIPSKKAEKFKLWLAKLGNDKIDEIFDPSKGIDQMIDFYLNKGYSFDWILNRIISIINRKKITKVWHDHGINNDLDYAILTNENYKEWSGMTAQEYKKFKNIRKESLRDNMTDIELALTDISEIAARDIALKEHPKGLDENINVAKRGGKVANAARVFYESETKQSAVSNSNNLNYQYIENNTKKEIERDE